MTLPATVRVNARVPFPALVVGANFISLTKANGVWTVQADYTKLSSLLNVNDLPTSLVAIYDPVTKQFATATASQVGATSSGTRIQRSITSSAQLPIVGADSILNFNVASDLTPSLPAFASRAGAPITINNKPGSHTQTVGVAMGDTIDGLTSVTILAGQRMTFWPYNDGVNAGYFIN